MSTFKALRCDFCNGGLIIDDSREFAVCEFCGTKYMASTLRAKIQEIRGTVKVEGAVETTIGSSEKDRLLKNANAFYRIGEIEKALKEYGAIQDKFPECVDAWKNSLEIIVNEGLCATGPSNYAETIVKEIIRHCRVLERLMGERFSIKYYRDIFFNNICKGKIFILFQTGMVNPFDVLKPFLLKEQVEFITKQSKENAKKVNDLNILWKISGDLYYNYCISYIGVILYVKKCRPYDISTYDWIKAKVASNSQELEKCINTIQAERRDKGVCQNCGNSFKGRLHKVCSHCNKPKNY